MPFGCGAFSKQLILTTVPVVSNGGDRIGENERNLRADGAAYTFRFTLGVHVLIFTRFRNSQLFKNLRRRLLKDWDEAILLFHP